MDHRRDKHLLSEDSQRYAPLIAYNIIVIYFMCFHLLSLVSILYGINSCDQMAEMYGEVMELNERLHKDIATKDKSLESMTARLRKAGLEVRVYH